MKSCSCVFLLPCNTGSLKGFTLAERVLNYSPPKGNLPSSQEALDATVTQPTPRPAVALRKPPACTLLPAGQPAPGPGSLPVCLRSNRGSPRVGAGRASAACLSSGHKTLAGEPQEHFRTVTLNRIFVISQLFNLKN